ncbi:hypothetical protein RJ55_02860 [Drechmeria coniospora]|nr:hypothetical protein RJ55_02860 [Drechmeria coniospora]
MRVDGALMILKCTSVGAVPREVGPIFQDFGTLRREWCDQVNGCPACMAAPLTYMHMYGALDAHKYLRGIPPPGPMARFSVSTSRHVLAPHQAVKYSTLDQHQSPRVRWTTHSAASWAAMHPIHAIVVALDSAWERRAQGHQEPMAPTSYRE